MANSTAGKGRERGGREESGGGEESGREGEPFLECSEGSKEIKAAVSFGSDSDSDCLCFCVVVSDSLLSWILGGTISNALFLLSDCWGELWWRQNKK